MHNLTMHVETYLHLHLFHHTPLPYSCHIHGYQSQSLPVPSGPSLKKSTKNASISGFSKAFFSSNSSSMSFITTVLNHFTSSEVVKRSAITHLHSCFHSFISTYLNKIQDKASNKIHMTIKHMLLKYF